MAARTDLVILRPWRDGAVHAEVPTTSFHDDNDVISTHVQDVALRHLRETLCGVQWGHLASASGYRHAETVDCPKCRSLLLGEIYPGEKLAMRAVEDGVWEEA